jgi:hypothetical protein
MDTQSKNRIQSENKKPRNDEKTHPIGDCEKPNCGVNLKSNSGTVNDIDNRRVAAVKLTPEINRERDKLNFFTKIQKD